MVEAYLRDYLKVGDRVTIRPILKLSIEAREKYSSQSGVVQNIKRCEKSYKYYDYVNVLLDSGEAIELLSIDLVKENEEFEFEYVEKDRLDIHKKLRRNLIQGYTISNIFNNYVYLYYDKKNEHYYIRVNPYQCCKEGVEAIGMHFIKCKFFTKSIEGIDYYKPIKLLGKEYYAK